MNHIALPPLSTLPQNNPSSLFLNPSHSVTFQCNFQDCGKSFKKQQDFEKHTSSHPKQPKQSLPDLVSLLAKGTSNEGFSAYVHQNLIKQDPSIQCKDEEVCPQTTSNGRERNAISQQNRDTLKTECKMECKARTSGSDVSTEVRTVCGKRPNEDDDDRLVTLALMENHALKKRLFVTRATVLAVYRQLVFLESFVSNKRAS